MRPIGIALAAVFALLALSSVAQARPGHPGPRLDAPSAARPACDKGPLRDRLGTTPIVHRGDRPVHPARGSSVKILWGGQWWDGTMLATRNGRYYVHYTGYDDSWDEWVTRDRLQLVQPPTERPRHGALRGPVQILWGGQWWNGRVLERRGDRYYITYDGYDASWNEWVGPDRVRSRRQVGSAAGLRRDITMVDTWGSNRTNSGPSGSVQSQETHVVR